MKTLKEVLNDEFSPDKMDNFTPTELACHLVGYGIIGSSADMNRLVIEGIQKALAEDDEFPIKYYAPGEEMNPEAKIVDPGECLTDKFIQDVVQA